MNDTDDPFEWHGIDPLRLATMASSLPWVCPQPARGRAYSSVLDSPRARRSFGSILDPGQAVESISGGSHIVLLGWLFFVLVPRLVPLQCPAGAPYFDGRSSPPCGVAARVRGCVGGKECGQRHHRPPVQVRQHSVTFTGNSAQLLQITVNSYIANLAGVQTPPTR